MRFRLLRIAMLTAALAAAAFMLLGAVDLLGIDRWTNFDLNKIKGCDKTSIIYDSDGEVLLRLHGAQDRTWTALNDLKPHVYNAFISAEDARFFDHDGIDLIRIAGAIVADIKAGEYVQGASTISQQLVKLSHLTSEKTISRKAEEAVLAYQMEQRCSKEEILEMYLNYVYFGGGYYGIEAAALGYFGVHARELSLSQSAMLAGILKSPLKYAPHIDYEACIGRRNHILFLMEDYGCITPEERDAAIEQRPNIVKGLEKEYSGYYTDAVMKNAAGVLGVTIDRLITGGYNIYSGMERKTQLYCEELFKREELFPAADAQGAIVVQKPDTGMVIAMVGGRSYDGAMAFNRAADIRRQPGSVIKPIISYGPALEYLGCTAADMILDEKTTFSDYTPSNFGEKYYGWVTLREAVTRSLNVPAVKILSQVGVDRAKQFAAMCGIEFDKRDDSLALALGGFTYGVSPLQIAGAYSCFASGGRYNTPSLIRKITDSRGKVLYEYHPERRMVMSEGNAYILTSMMKSVVSEGTGHRLNALNIPIAGKTGTVGAAGGNRDAWMASYTPDYTAVVWMGYDNDKAGVLPPRATGGSYPAMILSELYSVLYSDKGGGDFEMPSEVRECGIDARTLEASHRVVLANALTPKESRFNELFAEGTAPKSVTGYWSVPAGAQNLSAVPVQDGVLVSFDCPDDFAEYILFKREGGGKAKTVGKWDGKEGHIEYLDWKTDAGGKYSYQVIPRHKEMVIGEKAVRGLPTGEVTVEVPDRVINLTLE